MDCYADICAINKFHGAPESAVHLQQVSHSIIVIGLVVASGVEHSWVQKYSVTFLQRQLNVVFVEVLLELGVVER